MSLLKVCIPGSLKEAVCINPPSMLPAHMHESGVPRVAAVPRPTLPGTFMGLLPEHARANTAAANMYSPIFPSF